MPGLRRCYAASAMHGLGIVPCMLPIAFFLYAWRRYRSMFFLLCAGLYWILCSAVLGIDVWPF